MYLSVSSVVSFEDFRYGEFRFPFEDCSDDDGSFSLEGCSDDDGSFPVEGCSDDDGRFPFECCSDEEFRVHCVLNPEENSRLRLGWYSVNHPTKIDLSRWMPLQNLTRSTIVYYKHFFFLLGGLEWQGNNCDGRDYFYIFDGIKWRQGTVAMLQRRYSPSVVIIKEKIYVFAGVYDWYDPKTATFAEVYDIEVGKWTALPLPPDPNLNPIGDSCPVVVYPPSRILVHFCSNDSLYVFHVDDRSWSLLHDNFCGWLVRPAMVGNILYYLSPQYDCFCLSAEEISLFAFDLFQKKELPTKLISEFSIDVPSGRLFYLGRKNFCHAWYLYSCNTLCYIKFRVYKKSGVVCIRTESKPVNKIKYESRYDTLYDEGVQMEMLNAIEKAEGLENKVGENADFWKQEFIKRKQGTRTVSMLTQRTNNILATQRRLETQQKLLHDHCSDSKLDNLHERIVNMISRTSRNRSVSHCESAPTPSYLNHTACSRTRRKPERKNVARNSVANRRPIWKY